MRRRKLGSDSLRKPVFAGRSAQPRPGSLVSAGDSAGLPKATIGVDWEVIIARQPSLSLEECA